MFGRGRASVTVEEYVERRSESAAGRVVWRRYRRSRWEPTPERTTTRQVVDTAVPLLRAVAIAMVPALGRLAVRALAPRMRAALPGRRGPRVLSARALPPLSLLAPGAGGDERDD
jgi:hypothetical protein